MIEYYEQTRNMNALIKLAYTLKSDLENADMITINKIMKILYQFDQFKIIYELFEAVDNENVKIDLSFINF